MQRQHNDARPRIDQATFWLLCSVPTGADNGARNLLRSFYEKA